MINLAEPTVTGREAEYVARCLADGWLSSVGPMVDSFERRLAEVCGRSHALAVSSGTAALHLALRATGVQPGELVLTQSFTFVATSNAVHMAGAVPLFIDSDMATWNMGVDGLQAVLAQCQRSERGVVHVPTGRRVGAIMPVLILGLCADIDALCCLAAEFDIPVVVDAAEALGAVYRGKPGTARGLISCLSFNGNKVMTTGSGGAVLTDDPEIARRCRHLSTQAKADGLDHIHDEAGYNYRMAAVNAAIGLAQLEALDSFLTAKARIATHYRQAFARDAGITCMPTPSEHSDWPWLFSILVPKGRETVQRLNQDGIGARRLWRPMHMQPPYQDCPIQPGGMPVAESLYERGLSLPSSVTISEENLNICAGKTRSIIAEFS